MNKNKNVDEFVSKFGNSMIKIMLVFFGVALLIIAITKIF